MPGNGKKSFIETMIELVDRVLRKAAGAGPAEKITEETKETELEEEEPPNR